MVIERLAYDGLTERYDVDIFTANQTGQDFSKASAKLKRHVYDHVVTDSDIERKFADQLDTASEVVVYAKLPRGFLIPTPVGDYNPDWAISFKEGSVKHIYFVAETKGTMSSLKLREIENTRSRVPGNSSTKSGHASARIGSNTTSLPVMRSSWTSSGALVPEPNPKLSGRHVAV